MPTDLLRDRKAIHVKAYVVNTHNSDEFKEHWVAIFFKYYEAYYFDSYGLPSLEEHIQLFLQINCRRFDYNKTIRLQDDNSIMCRVYCVLALGFLAQGCDLNIILSITFSPENWAKYDKCVGRCFRQCYEKLNKHATERMFVSMLHLTEEHPLNSLYV